MTHLDSIANQTILVQTTYHPAPHLEIEMEIMERLLAQGNTVYWIICKSDFKNCFNNPEHKVMDCKVCFSRVNNGLNALKNGIENHKNLHVLQYNQFLKLDDFKKNNFKKEFSCSTVNDLKTIHYKSYDSGMATASSLVSFTRNHEPQVENHRDFIYRGLLTGAYLYETFQLILDKIKPDLVVLFNGRFIENRPLLRVCQERKVNYATHERGGKINNFLFRINSIPHSIETISNEMEHLWENAKNDRNQIGKLFYTNRIKRVEDAWYSFTKEQQEGRLPESFNANEDKKVITIFNSSLDEYEGLEGFGPFFYPNDNEGIKQICESLESYSNIKLYLRVHPNLKGLDNSQNKFLKEKISKFTSIEIIPAEDSVDTYALIHKSDIVIVFGSTVGAEAAFANKNVILLGRAAYENLNCVVIPKNHEELIQILTDDQYEFPTINPEGPLKYGYWNESFGIENKYYKPIHLGKGKYKGKQIKANFILRELRRFLEKRGNSKQ
ncbi:capsular polysaccharide export protein, LipB/KpsS family [Flavobacterium psychrotolerans]|uniref:Capsule biosynthesis protein n=1 Tax=Flavobacterium psychrotolerans TaxID=2169410 RepID=A0A2U1JLW4_9FLAO|nr:hypothetical protein [Flavobacterium psychrotolerans]PWA06140.1 hypothetical protein DB895_04355 [Flavobacterium psychrotolerans]